MRALWAARFRHEQIQCIAFSSQVVVCHSVSVQVRSPMWHRSEKAERTTLRLA